MMSLLSEGNNNDVNILFLENAEQPAIYISGIFADSLI